MAHLRIGILGRTQEAALHAKAWEDANVDVVRFDGASAPGTGYFRELSTVLAGRQVQAVSLCVPAAARRALAVDCLEHGIHVLAELPLAGDPDAAQALLDAARVIKTGSRTLMVPATPFRFLPDVELVRGILGGGGLGDIKSFRLTLSTPCARTGKEAASQQPPTGAGILFEVGSHAFDLTRHLFGRPVMIRAMRGDAAAAGLAPVKLRLSYPGNAIGDVTLAPALTAVSAPFLVVEGSEGTIEVGWHASTCRMKGQMSSVIGSGNQWAPAYRRMAGLFAATLRRGGGPWISLAECYRVLESVRLAQESLVTGRAVDLPVLYQGAAA
jgi:predicted dehydrogenase